MVILMRFKRAGRAFLVVTPLVSYSEKQCQGCVPGTLGVANGKFKTLQDGKSSVFLYEPETFTL